ncbi:LAFA_0D12354g1_1 [Lachancea sp. 'fantastica']|nr:LAFA_0D12354g1_1 [Lachancea sp. 'fantastica']
MNSSSSVEQTIDSPHEGVLPTTGPTSEYEDDNEESGNDENFGTATEVENGSTTRKWENFCLRSGINHFVLTDDGSRVVLALKQGQEVMIAGSFQLQILKGGIKYNDVHYNASQRSLKIWHPSCSSMSPISSSFFAGWKEQMFITSEISKTGLVHKDFECILLITNRCSELLGISRLDYTFSNLWVSRDYFTSTHNASSQKSSFSILTRSTMRDVSSVLSLNISSSWAKKLDELSLFHRGNSHDMRVMVLGGKNSGKSTFLRLLLQRFLHVDNEDDESIFYLDVDPGQTEYSGPDCISLSSVQKDLELGNPLGQSRNLPIVERYVGTNSPSAYPTKYLAEITELIESFSNEVHMGTTVLNVPGWVKGFGIQIVNNIISRFKPTHILLLGSVAKNRSLLNELQMDKRFSTPQRENYETKVDFIDGYHGSSTDFSLKARIQPYHMRQFRLLSHFHRVRSLSHNIEYDFTPLMKQSPFRVSFGTSGPVRAFKLPTSGDKWTDSNIKDMLEGTIVGIFKPVSSFDVQTQGSFPVTEQNVSGEFLSLGFIHSINIQEAYINIFLPSSRKNNVADASTSDFLIERRKTETPVCELFPQDKSFNDCSELKIPFVSSRKPKKYEYVWKVRRNIQRRGHLTK